MKFLILFMMSFRVHAAEVTCPPLPAGAKPNFTVYNMCDGNAPNCQDFELLTGGAKYLDLASRADLVVEKAEVVKKPEETFASSHYRLDEASACRFAKFQRKYQGKKIAVVGAGKILLTPPAPEDVKVSEILLSVGDHSTYRENADVCVAIFASCETGNVSWQNFKESSGRSFDKVYRAVAGEKSQAD